jgi:hypothetical protein
METARMETENMFKTMSDSFKTMLDNSMRFQQDVFKTMTGFVNSCETMDDCRGKIETVANDSIGMVKKNAETMTRTFEEASRNNMSMFRKTFDMSKVEPNKDMIAQASDFWHTALDTMRGNVEATAKSATQMIENFSDFVSKSNQVATTRKSGK